MLGGAIVGHADANTVHRFAAHYMSGRQVSPANSHWLVDRRLSASVDRSGSLSWKSWPQGPQYPSIGKPSLSSLRTVLKENPF